MASAKMGGGQEGLCKDKARKGLSKVLEVQADAKACRARCRAKTSSVARGMLRV